MKGSTWQVPSQGGQWWVCVEGLTSLTLLNAPQLSEAALLSVSFNSSGVKRLIFTVAEVCHREKANVFT